MMHMARRLGLALLLLGAAGAAQAQVVISQVYGGGGNSGATYKSDFIELHNNSTSPVNLSGWSVQYASSSGTSWTRTNLSGSIAPGGYYLVKQADGAGGTTNLPTPDATGTIAMSATAGKVALVSNQTTLSGSCPLGGAVVDFVGFGSANCAETAPTAAPSNTTAVLRAADGCTDTDNNSADFAVGAPTPRNSASPLRTCGPVTPVISINDVSLPEGNSGTTAFTFTVSLSAPAPAGGVSFDIATSDGTATAGSDYQAKALTNQVIPAGQTTYSFTVLVYGDTVPELNESFVVTLSNVVGALPGDLTGLGTILNDDTAALSIGQIQGNSWKSPYEGYAVVTTGVVTAKRTSGFFLQSIVGDGDPATSDGIYVFTGGAPSVNVGDAVQVTGTVAEFYGTSPLPTTQLLPSNIAVTSSGNPLPAPVVITAAMTPPNSTPDTLEYLEGMRVAVPSGRIVAPSPGTSNSDTLTASDLNGEFEIVVDGVPRPLREAGISIFDPFPIPPAKQSTIPYFDGNQERLKVYPLIVPPGGTPRVDARGTVTGLVGVLTYFGNSYSVPAWEILYDAAEPPTIVSGTAQAVPAPQPEDLTVAGFNLLRFFNDQNDGPGPVYTSANFDKRVTKAAAVICDWLQTPDILGAVEVENLSTLQTLGNKLNATCDKAPQYQAYLVPGNDVGGINVGFLVNTRSVGVPPRVEVVEVEQHGKAVVQKNADGTPSSKLLNDRPPLRMKAVVHFANGRSFPLTVVVAHQRSLGSIDSTAPGSLGYATKSEEVRAKRGEQAVYLAGLVRDIQNGVIGGVPGEKVIVVGDFNAFDVNDGYVDALGITVGTPAPAPQVLSWYDSPLTAANGGTPLVVGNTLTADPDERYSYIYANITQTLDHALVSQSLLTTPGVDAVFVDHARVNADFREAYLAQFNPPYTAANPPLRTSDHDPVRVTVRLGEAGDASAAWRLVNNHAKGVFTTLTVVNNGPDALQGAQVRIDISMPSDASAAVAPPTGWTCTRVAGSAGSFQCSTSATLVAGAAQLFNVSVRPRIGFPAGQRFRFSATVTSASADTTPGNNTAILDLP